MADKKVTALTDIGTTIAADDVWMVIDSPGSSPTNKKMEVQNFTRYHPSPIGWSQAPNALTSVSTVMDVTSAISTIATGAGALALSLANGAHAGQLKFITIITAGGGTATITPATLNGWSTLASATDGHSAVLMYIDATHGWSVISNNGFTLA